MNILMSFIPWIIFATITKIQSMLIGAIIGVIVYLLIYLKKRTHLKMLDYWSISFFIVLAILSEGHYSEWISQHLGYLANGFLALVIFGSILIKKPFSVSYAKEITPEDKWHTKTFKDINMGISVLWLLFFVFSLAIQPLSNLSTVSFIILQIFFVVLAMKLTKKFPEFYVKRLAKS